MKHISPKKLFWMTIPFLVVAGCTQQGPPPAPHAANDPAGLGTPQERLKALEANTTMPAQLKARKMKLLQDEISGTVSSPGRR